MTQITINSLDRRWNVGLFIHAITAVSEAFRDQIRVRRTRREIMAELDQYGPDEIMELGISKADIPFVAEDAARR